EPAGAPGLRPSGVLRVSRRRSARPGGGRRRPAYGSPPRHAGAARTQARAPARDPLDHHSRSARHDLPRRAGRPNVARSDTQPLLAAVVIARNEERWIDTCLRSVLAAVAPFAGSEVVLVDSRSSDGTVERARRFPVRVVELRPDAPLSRALG